MIVSHMLNFSIYHERLFGGCGYVPSIGNARLSNQAPLGTADILLILLNLTCFPAFLVQRCGNSF